MQLFGTIVIGLFILLLLASIIVPQLDRARQEGDES